VCVCVCVGGGLIRSQARLERRSSVKQLRCVTDHCKHCQLRFATEVCTRCAVHSNAEAANYYQTPAPWPKRSHLYLHFSAHTSSYQGTTVSPRRRASSFWPLANPAWTDHTRGYALWAHNEHVECQTKTTSTGALRSSTAYHPHNPTTTPALLSLHSREACG